MPLFLKKFFFFLFLLSLNPNPLLADSLWDNAPAKVRTYELKLTDKIHTIFFGLTRREDLRIYRKGRFGLSGGDMVKVKFRTRGLMPDHWGGYNKSLKIRYKDADGRKRYMNFNSIHSEISLEDFIAYRIYNQAGLIAPVMELSEFIINGSYNGLKLKLENLDQDFLDARGIPLGNIYRESIAACLIDFRNWSTDDNKKYWERETLKKQDNLEDWLSFLEINASDDDDIFFRYIEKYLDMEKYLKWYALTNLMGGRHNIDHNLVFVNNFQTQKFQQIGYDTAGFLNPDLPIYFYSNHFSARILTRPEYYFLICKYIYEFLQGAFSRKNFYKTISTVYSILEGILENHSKNYESNNTLQTEEAGYEYKLDFMFKDKDASISEKIKSKKDDFIRWYDSRYKYLMKAFDDAALNINYKNKGTASILEFILKGGSGVRIRKISLVSDQNLQKADIRNVRLCYDKNGNTKIDKDETCFIHSSFDSGSTVNFENTDDSFPFLLPKLKATPKFSKGDIKTVWKQRELNWEPKLYKFIFINDRRFRLKAVEIESMFTGTDIAVSDKPILLTDDNYLFGPEQKVFIKPALSNLTKGMEDAEITWNGLPDWLAVSEDGKTLSGTVPRHNPEIVKIVLNLHIKGREFKYPLFLHIRKWDRFANIASFINPAWAAFIESEGLLSQVRSRLRSALKKKYYRLAAIWNTITDFESIFKKRGFRIDQSWVNFDVLENNREITWGPGIITVKKTTVLPATSKLYIKPGTRIEISKGKGIIFHGVVKAIGDIKNKIVFTSSEDKEYFGSLIFNQWSLPGSEFKDVIIERGKDFFWKERFYSGALSIYNTPVRLKSVTFRYNKGDDALNARYSSSTIESSNFYDNAADAIDFDFSSGIIRNNIFVNNGNDAIDCGTSIPLIDGNWIEGSGDKGISLGEESKPEIKNNVLCHNKIGIAIKDGSYPSIDNTLIFKNHTGISMYIKKRSYRKPGTIVSRIHLIANDNDIELNNSTFIESGNIYIYDNDIDITSEYPIKKTFSIFTKENSKVDPELRLDSNKIGEVFRNRKSIQYEH